MNKLSIMAGAALLVLPQLLPLTAGRAATVSRSGTLHVTATFTKSSDFSLPVRCSVTIDPNGQHGAISEVALQQGQELTFSGNTATCDITISFALNNIDADTGITVVVDVESDVKAGFTGSNLNPDLVQMSRSWSDSFGIPDNGANELSFGNLTL